MMGDWRSYAQEVVFAGDLCRGLEISKSNDMSVGGLAYLSPTSDED